MLGFDVKRVARELGVRYVLEGSVRKSGNRVRITAQLIDTITGAHLWTRGTRLGGSVTRVARQGRRDVGGATVDDWLRSRFTGGKQGRLL